MVINNTQGKILGLLVQNPSQEYSIRELSKKIKVNYRQVYEEIQTFSTTNLIILNKKGQMTSCRLNAMANLPLCMYIESVRKYFFVKKHSFLKVIEQELNKISTTYYSLILFGSYAKGKARPSSDIDLLFIIPKNKDRESFQQEVKNIFQFLNYKLDINVITEEDVLSLRNTTTLNIVNEVKKNHIILAGAEMYYKLIFQ